MSERVYASLRDEVVAGHLLPGAALSEVEQAARLGVSRTPLREALGRLASEGLVVARGRTLVVSQLREDDVRALFELREGIEPQAVRLAARRGDRAVFAGLAARFASASALLSPADPDRVAYYGLVAELDDAVDAALDSPHLLRALQGMRVHAARARRLSRDDPARLVSAAREHQLIAESVAEGDEVLAAQATAVHLRASLRSIVANLRQHAREERPPEPPHPRGARP